MSITQRAEKFTDVGNAKRLVDRHGEKIRFVHSWKLWLVWDGKRWQREAGGELMRLAKETIRDLFDHVSSIEDDDRRDRFAEHVRRSERLERLRAMVTLARSEPGIPIRAEQLDSNPWLLNCKSGTLDLRTGELRKHRRDDFITKLAPVKYDAEATSQIWEDFIAKATRDDPELEDFLQKAAGYTLTGSTKEEALFLLIGGTATGKSTFVEALKAALGDYAATADFETFLRQQQTRGPRNDLARLQGARMVSAIEVSPGRQFDEAMVNTATGVDTISVRFLHREFFEYKPQFKIWLAANHKPAVRDDDPAMWRRLKVLPFTEEIPADEQDPEVKLHLQDPNGGGEAVLRWLIEGALKWQREGLREPAVVQAETQEYRAEMETFSQFIEDRCIESIEQWVASSALRAAYETWNQENGFRFPYGPQRMKRVLRGRGHSPEKRGNVRGWRGIGLVEAAG